MAVPAHKNAEHFTYSDYLNWPKNERWELIDGKPYDMSPAPSRYHQYIQSKLITEFNNRISEKKQDCEVYGAPFDVRMPAGNEPDDKIITVVQPDISIICDKKKLDDLGCKGAPELIVEIISPNTAKKDLGEKMELYQNQGVREYWIIYPNEKIVSVFKPNKNKTYQRPTSYSPEDTITVTLKETMEIILKNVF